MVQQKRSSSVASFTTPDILVLTRYHAACMAATGIRAKMMGPSSPSSSPSLSSANDLVRYSTQLCRLEAIASGAMASYIDILSKMDSNEDKVASLFKSPCSFEVVDLHMLEKAMLGTTSTGSAGCNGTIPPLPQDMLDKIQIVLQMSKSDDDAIADESTTTTTATERAKKTLHQFVECLAEALGPSSSSFDDALSLVALRVLDHCKSSGTAALLSEENGHMSSHTKLDLIDDERALILFRLIDADASGCISFEEISNSLLHLMKDGMDPNLRQIWAVLLLSGKDDSRKLDFPHFSGLLLNAIAASKGRVDFDDICADLTISHCQHEEYAGGEGSEPFSLSENFRDDALKEILEEMRAVQQTDEEIVSVIQYKKMHKLFDLWDSDRTYLLCCVELFGLVWFFVELLFILNENTHDISHRFISQTLVLLILANSPFSFVSFRPPRLRQMRM